MIPRVLEPEVMDTVLEAADYDAMDHRAVNEVFVADFLALVRQQEGSSDPLSILDVGTGTAQIPVEFCRQSSVGQIVAIDLASEMLKLAEANIERENLSHRIGLQLCDSKQLPFANRSFSAVISNSIIHHIPEPDDCFTEMLRVLKPHGILFVRDLLRPTSQEEVEQLVELYAGSENSHSQQLFRQSLQAALTLDEVAQILISQGLPGDLVTQTSDRHWTVSGQLF